MGKTVQETERTYEAAPGQAAEPDLAGIDGVEAVVTPDPVKLDALYFDTQELALSARGITLRRRTGGEDAGWHLKLPGDRADTRTELHAPLGRSARTVPAALAAEVAAIVRGRPLVPVARIKSERHRRLLLGPDDTPLAEIAHDHVTAQLLGGDKGDEVAVIRWTETEAELLGGDVELLDAAEERLVAAGYRRSAFPSKLLHALGERVPPAPPGPPEPRTAGAVALAYLHRQVADLIRYDAAVRRDEPDAVHRMRVATRRMRSALRSYRRELDRSATDPIVAELTWLAGVLGTERDREVLGARLEQLIGELVPGLATPALTGRVHGRFTAEHADVHAYVLGELDSRRYFTLLDTLDALLAAPPLLPAAERPAKPAVTRTVRRDHRRLARRVGAALDLPPGRERDVALHEARKAAKRARYAAESAEPLLGKPAKSYRRRVTEVQSVLGEHQDSVMARAAVTRLADEARAEGEDTFAFGAIYQMERFCAAALETALPKVWARADRGRFAR